MQPVSPGYLKALGVPLLAGEDIDGVAGDSTAAPSAIISKRMADRFWPGRNPVGESFLLGPRAVRVIGVAGDVRTTRLDSIAGYTAYVPDRQLPLVHVSLVVRTDGDPARLAGPVRAAIREVLPSRPISGCRAAAGRSSSTAPKRSSMSDVRAIFRLADGSHAL